MSKNIDSFSVFLETVDPGVRASKANGTTPSRELGLSVLGRLKLAGGSAPTDAIRSDLGLGVREFDRIVDELLDLHLATLDGGVLRLATGS